MISLTQIVRPMAQMESRPGPDHPDWKHWRWQMQNRIHSPEALRDWIDPTDDELAAIERTGDEFRWNITPYYAGLMDPTDPSCPVRQQVVPTMDEFGPNLVDELDPLDETGHEGSVGSIKPA